MEESRVLVHLVEDNDSDLELTLRALRSVTILRHQIHVSRDGEEALDYLFARNSYNNRNKTDLPKFIILDLKLPKINGLEVLQAIKNDALLKTIPVIILTSSNEESGRVKSYHYGVNSYIVKPIEFDLFMEEVSKLGFYWLKLNKTTS